MRFLLKGTQPHGDCKNHEVYLFFCPACKHGHVYTIKCDYAGPKWDFNGDMNNPTFSPSLLLTTPFKPEDGGEERCHLFVRNGKIEFCSDSTHELAGKTVRLPDLDKEDE